MKERRKDTKKQKEERRIYEADLYNRAFMHGYWIGKEEGKKEAKKEGAKGCGSLNGLHGQEGIVIQP
jgi:hypothetical protein